MTCKTMKIIELEELGDMFNQEIIPLRYTPKKMVVNPLNNNLIVVESSHRAFNQIEKDKINRQIYSKDRMNEIPDEREVGVAKTNLGKWACCIRVFDPVELKTVSI